jgi:hypothetical protein
MKNTCCIKSFTNAATNDSINSATVLGDACQSDRKLMIELTAHVRIRFIALNFVKIIVRKMFSLIFQALKNVVGLGWTFCPVIKNTSTKWQVLKTEVIQTLIS